MSRPVPTMRSPVLWAYHAGVVNGCGADTFCPTQAISRQDLTVILYRYAASRALQTRRSRRTS